MKRFAIIASVLAPMLAVTPAPANDTAAVVGVGGLEFVVTQDVRMVSENLHISRDAVRMSYVFRNESEDDLEVLVAFPMPDLTTGMWHDNFAYPDGPDENLFGFATRFNEGFD